MSRDAQYVSTPKQWGVRCPNGEIFAGINQGDAENLVWQVDGELVTWDGTQWKEVDTENE